MSCLAFGKLRPSLELPFHPLANKGVELRCPSGPFLRPQIRAEFQSVVSLPTLLTHLRDGDWNVHSVTSSSHGADTFVQFLVIPIPHVSDWKAVKFLQSTSPTLDNFLEPPVYPERKLHTPLPPTSCISCVLPDGSSHFLAGVQVPCHPAAGPACETWTPLLVSERHLPTAGPEDGLHENSPIT